MPGSGRVLDNSPAPAQTPNPQRRDELARLEAEIAAAERAHDALPERAGEENAALRERLRLLRYERAIVARQR